MKNFVSNGAVITFSGHTSFNIKDNISLKALIKCAWTATSNINLAENLFYISLQCQKYPIIGDSKMSPNQGQ